MSYGGDELSGIVIDPGSSTVKAGNAGEDHPRLVFPSELGERSQHSSSADRDDKQCNSTEHRKRELDCFTTKREGLEARSPFGANGLVDDFDAFESLLWYCLGEDSPRKLVLESNEHPIMLTEPPHNPPKSRERMVERLFEKFNVPAVFLAKQPVLSSFAVGRTTSLVLDLGHSGTTATAVHDGYALQRSIQHSPIGGETLSKLILQDMEQGRNICVRPHIAISKKQRTDGQFDVQDVDISNVSPSFLLFKRMELAAQAKEEVCRCPKGTPYSEEEYAKMPTSSFELPDGTVVEYGGTGFKLPEVLFQPELASSFAGGWQEEYSLPQEGATRMVLNAINSCDTDIRKDLFPGVILTGGSSLFPHMKERIEAEYLHAAPSTSKARVIAQQSSSERRFAPFIGGSILASLGTFQQFWMSKAEFDEQGANFIQRKAP